MYEFSPYIRQNTPFLKELASTKSDSKKNKLIQEATVEQILAIVEICANILKFNFTLTKLQKRRLAKYADFYRELARTRTEGSARKKLQKGNGIVLGALLAPVLSALAEELITRVTK